MFPYLRVCFQLSIAAALLVLVQPVVADAQTEDDSFVTLEDYPWVGWHGPISDGLHGLRFGIGGHEANAVMREKGLEPIQARPYTLRYKGAILDQPAEVMGEFTTSRPSAKGAQLRVIQIRWELRGLASASLNLFGRLDSLMQKRYGDPVKERDDAVSNLETGAGRIERLYYGTNARVWLELASRGSQHYAVLVRMECPQIPDPRDEED